jgi:hypothetical protein
MLLDYLDKKFKSEEIFINDLKRCRAYVESAYTCQTINNEKELVLNLFETIK